MSKSMRIVCDVDGVIANVPNARMDELAGKTPNYAGATAYKDIVGALKQAKKDGHYIILHTSRYMHKAGATQADAEKQGHVELALWLQENGVPYDELHMGKPYGDIYIDDKACKVQGSEGINSWNSAFFPASASYELETQTADPEDTPESILKGMEDPQDMGAINISGKSQAVLEPLLSNPERKKKYDDYPVMPKHGVLKSAACSHIIDSCKCCANPAVYYTKLPCPYCRDQADKERSGK